MQTVLNNTTKNFLKDNSTVLPIPFSAYVDDKGHPHDPAWNSDEAFASNYYSGYVFIEENYVDAVERYLDNIPAESKERWKVHQYFIASKNIPKLYRKRGESLVNQLELNDQMWKRTLDVVSNIKIQLSDTELSVLNPFVSD